MIDLDKGYVRERSVVGERVERCVILSALRYDMRDKQGGFNRGEAFINTGAFVKEG